MQRTTGLTMAAMAGLIAVAGCGQKRTDVAAETTTGTTDTSGSATAPDAMAAPVEGSNGMSTGAMSSSDGMAAGGTTGGTTGMTAPGMAGDAMAPTGTETSGAMDKGSGGGAASGTGTSQTTTAGGTAGSTPPN